MVGAVLFPEDVVISLKEMAVALDLWKMSGCWAVEGSCTVGLLGGGSEGRGPELWGQ